MKRIQIETSEAPRPGGAYSQGIVAGGLLHTAGIGPQDPSTGLVIGTTIEEQTGQVMRNLRAVLAARGLDFASVVKVTVHLNDLSRDFQGFNAIYREFLVEPYPVRTTVGSTLANILVEIDLIAVCEDN